MASIDIETRVYLHNELIDILILHFPPVIGTKIRIKDKDWYISDVTVIPPKVGQMNTEVRCDVIDV